MASLRLLGFKKAIAVCTLLLTMALLPSACALADSPPPDNPDTTVTDTSSVDTSNSSNQAATTSPAADVTNQTPPDNTPDTQPAADTSDSLPPASPADDQSSPITQLACPDPSLNPTVDAQNQADAANNSTIDNNLCSTATSGDATITGANNGGNATSGDASASLTLLNLISSVNSLGGYSPLFFNQDVYGNQQNNIYIDPGTLLAMLQNYDPTTSNASIQDVNNAQINNNIVLNANSGNASVTNDGRGGTATSGNATAIANIINIINTLNSGGQVFIGTINIYGNLDGNILLPYGFLDSLLAANSPVQGSGEPPPGQDGSLTANITNNALINNNLTLNATSGDASVNNDGRGGRATTGNATTSLNLLDLTNQELIGGNDLLVFVNVLGNWVGLILNAPAGTTAAELGGGISYQGNNQGNSGDINLGLDNNAQINNNITLNASSGDATVNNNGRGGKASSGNASSSLSLANVINSNLSLSGWLGVLFINVFGNWNGSLATLPPPAIDDPLPSDPPSTGSGGPVSGSNPKTNFGTGTTSSSSDDSTPPDTNQHVLGNSIHAIGAPVTGPGSNNHLRTFLLCGLILGNCFLAYYEFQRRQA